MRDDRDIVDKLRATITDMEFYEAPGEWLVPVEQAKAEIESLRQKTQYWPDNAERDAVIRHQKEEIESLCARLEMDPSHPYDGIYARDETIRGLEKEIDRLRAGGCARDQGTTQYCAEAAKKDAEIASLLNLLADARTESMRLRAALRLFACDCSERELCKFPHGCTNYIARAALEAEGVLAKQEGK